MLYQVIHGGWLYEIEAPQGAHVEFGEARSPELVIPGPECEGGEEHLKIPAVIRAAKDHLFGLTRLRAWKLDATRPGTVAARDIIPIREVS